MRSGLKRELLELDQPNYVALSKESIPAQLEAAQLLRESAPFLTDDRNLILSESLTRDGTQPLMAIASHLQEDLVPSRRGRGSRISSDCRRRVFSKWLDGPRQDRRVDRSGARAGPQL